MFERAGAWLAGNWVAAAGFMAAAMLTLAPVLGPLGAPLLLILLHGPIYMVHQVEEHTGDRFRSFVNTRIFGGRDTLTTGGVLIINLPMVWGVNLAALYAAASLGPNAGLVAPYVMLVNAVIHLAAVARLRAYNPGLATAIVLFLPLSVATIVVIVRDQDFHFGTHALALFLALAVHAGIVAVLLLRDRRLASAARSHAAV